MIAPEIDPKTYYRRRRVLVTGGRGFIAGHLVKALRHIGARVRVLDISDEGPQVPGVEYVKGDVCDPEVVREVMEGCSVVFHFAALLGVERIRNRPLSVMEVNLGGTMTTAKAAANLEVERFVLASSSEVYGEPEKIPIAETDRLSPVSTYGVSKVAAEEYCRAFHREGGLRYSAVRFFNVYGPGQDEEFVISKFVAAAANGDSPVIYGDGSQFRAYTYVDDAVDALLTVGCHPRAVGEVFNVGTSESPTTVRELAEMAAAMGGNGVHPVTRDFGSGIREEKREVRRRMPDASKAERMLGWKASTPLREGLARCFAWYQHEECEVDQALADAYDLSGSPD